MYYPRGGWRARCAGMRPSGDDFTQRCRLRPEELPACQAAEPGLVMDGFLKRGRKLGGLAERNANRYPEPRGNGADGRRCWEALGGDLPRFVGEGQRMACAGEGRRGAGGTWPWV